MKRETAPWYIGGRGQSYETAAAKNNAVKKCQETRFSNSEAIDVLGAQPPKGFAGRQFLQPVSRTVHSYM
jgi:hypothetical protein